MIFDETLMTSFRSGELVDLKLVNIALTSCRGAECIVIAGHIGRRDGGTKACHGGLKMKIISIWRSMLGI